MTTGNEHLKSIQSRIEELEQTISEKTEQIKTRTQHLKEDIQTELTPVEMVRKHPLEVTGATFVAGFLLARFVGGLFGSKPKRVVEHTTYVDAKPSAVKTALGSIGIELLHSGKDLGLTYLRHYLDDKMKKPKA
jgi:hypothetical protein